MTAPEIVFGMTQHELFLSLMVIGAVLFVFAIPIMIILANLFKPSLTEYLHKFSDDRLNNVGDFFTHSGITYMVNRSNLIAEKTLRIPWGVSRGVFGIRSIRFYRDRSNQYPFAMISEVRENSRYETPVVRNYSFRDREELLNFIQEHVPDATQHVGSFTFQYPPQKISDRERFQSLNAVA